MLEIAPTDYLIHKLGKTRRDFCVEAGFGENHLLRLAQGRMNELSAAVVAAFEDRLSRSEIAELLDDGYGTPSLSKAYLVWRTEQQRKATLPDFIPYIEGLSPAQRFADAVGSMSKLAQVLRVNDYVVRRWVNGETKELPQQMRDAMALAGYPHADTIDKEQQAWLTQ